MIHLETDFASLTRAWANTVVVSITDHMPWHRPWSLYTTNLAGLANRSSGFIKTSISLFATDNEFINAKMAGCFRTNPVPGSTQWFEFYKQNIKSIICCLKWLCGGVWDKDGVISQVKNHLILFLERERGGGGKYSRYNLICQCTLQIRICSTWSWLAIV